MRYLQEVLLKVKVICCFHVAVEMRYLSQRNQIE